MLPLFISCSNHTVPSTNIPSSVNLKGTPQKLDDTQPLYGKWNWVSGSGGFTGGIITPQTPGQKPYTIEFTSDDHFNRYENGSLVTATTYQLTDGTTIVNHSTVTIIKYADNPRKQSLSLQGDTLLLFDEVYDGYTNGYVRIK